MEVLFMLYRAERLLLPAILLMLFLVPIGCSGSHAGSDQVIHEVVSQSSITVDDLRTASFRVIVHPSLSDEQLGQVFLSLDRPDFDLVTVWFYKDKSYMQNSQTGPIAVFRRVGKEGEIVIER
jgi:hypothetical protein